MYISTFFFSKKRAWKIINVFENCEPFLALRAYRRIFLVCMYFFEKNLFSPKKILKIDFTKILRIWNYYFFFVGMEAIMSEFFEDTTTAFYIILIVWVAGIISRSFKKIFHRNILLISRVFILWIFRSVWCHLLSHIHNQEILA